LAFVEVKAIRVALGDTEFGHGCHASDWPTKFTHTRKEKKSAKDRQWPVNVLDLKKVLNNSDQCMSTYFTSSTHAFQAK
jgi:hypothetical protein